MTGKDVDITPDPPANRTRVFIWGGIAVVLLVTVGVLSWIWVGNQQALEAAIEADELAQIEADRQAAIRDAAIDDAQAVTEATEMALTASATFESDVQLALVYLESTAIPVRDVIAGAVDEFGEEPQGTLTGAIETLNTSLEPPVLLPPGDQDDEGSQAARSPEPTIEPDPEEQAENPWGIAISFVAAEADARVRELHDHYFELEESAREAARAEIAAEIARFDDLGVEFEQASVELAAHVADVDTAIQQAAAAAAEVGAATQESVGSASDDALETLQLAIDALAAFAEMDIATEWEARTSEAPSALTGVVEAVDEYVSATKSARSSHAANREPEPYICYAYRWGGPHPTYCWR